MNEVYILHGVAERDENELVCQFFANRHELEEFQTDLPGRYDVLVATGINYDTLCLPA